LGLRDRALVLVGYAGAFRSSELAAIDCAHLSFTKDGLVIDLRRSKTDQEGSGRKVGIPLGKEEATCLVRALRRWLTESGIAAGAVFRGVNRHGKPSRRRLHKDCVGWILKRAARRAGLKPEPLGGHSLRAGHVTYLLALFVAPIAMDWSHCHRIGDCRLMAQVLDYCPN
jgi:integrase